MEQKITQKDIENAIYLSEQYQKSVEENPQTLFTLTAEETRIIIPLLENKIVHEKTWLKAFKDSEDIKEVRDCIDFHNNLLTRIKQWQDENNIS